ncbi:MAG: alpha/beta hydrolase [Burkholderiales bacterium]|nr:alpha/beta hydrolase [Burkholderiales bacterium]
MIDTYQQALPHGITLSCRAAGSRGRPLLVFLHGFPEAAFVWDELLAHFSKAENGGYRCVAPNLRGFEKSSTPAEVSDYRPRHLVKDIAALIEIEGAPAACLVAHDWGGALAWGLANQLPQLIKKLAIINSPHPGTFQRELVSNPRQQAASAYMNFLIRPDAEELLAANDYARMWPFFSNGSSNTAWLTDAVKDQYREVWNGTVPGGAPGTGLKGGCNYYRASPLRPPRPEDPAAAGVTLAREMLTISVPTFVLWAMDDVALPPELIDGLEDYIPKLTLEKVEGASHWIVHERPQFVAQRLGNFFAQ